MKKITIFELLRRIKDNEDIPQQIKRKCGQINETYKYNYEMGYYETLDGTTLLSINTSRDLSEEIEILDKIELPEKINWEEHIGKNLSEAVCNKLNEIIDYLKESKK